MFNKNITNKLVLVEVLIVLLPLIWYYLSNLQNKNLPADFIINLVFLLLLAVLLFFRNSSIRHMYLAFSFIVFSAISNTFGFDSFAYLSSALAVALLFLGVINMILFLPKTLLSD